VPRGRLITIEGLDGAGKSTLAEGLRASCQRRGIPVELMREPGGVQISERIRALVIDPALAMDPRTEALLYAAARAQLVAERLRPALERGTIVLLDRFSDSSLAYQGGGRGLGVEQVGALTSFATAGLVPDRTLLLRISPAQGRARQAGRSRRDRLEGASERFFLDVAETYERLARGEPLRIRVLDATRAPEQVLADALAQLEDLLASEREGEDL
jgi:dTMP kinase